MITGNTHPIEFKHIETIWVDSFVRLFVTSNERWAVPAAFSERRFGILDVGTACKNNIAYFTAILEEMKNGGREALLYYLLNFDLSTVNLREIPQTAALLEQKFESATSEEKFWLDTLISGKLPGAHATEPNVCLRYRFYEAYVRHAGRTGIRHRSIEVKLGMFLSTFVGKIGGDFKVTYTVYAPNGDKITKQGRAYKFPTLAECRKKFEVEINQEVNWGDVTAWQADEIIEIERAGDGDEEEVF